MQKIGKVISIINDRLFLVKIDGEIDVKKNITIYCVITNDKLKKVTNLDNIFIPKGSYQIVSEQDKNIYLASIITNKKRTLVYPPGSLGNAMTAVSNIFGTPIRSSITTEKDYSSAPLDPSQSLDIEISEYVVVGDFVGQ